VLKTSGHEKEEGELGVINLKTSFSYRIQIIGRTKGSSLSISARQGGGNHGNGWGEKTSRSVFQKDSFVITWAKLGVTEGKIVPRELKTKEFGWGGKKKQEEKK